MKIKTMKKEKRIWKNKKGEGYIDVCVTFLLISSILMLSLSCISLCVKNLDARNIAEMLAEYASMQGSIDVEDYVFSLKKKTGLDFSYSFQGTCLLDDGVHVQLGEPIFCTVTYEGSLKGFGEKIFPLEMKASASSWSCVYWKGEDG